MNTYMVACVAAVGMTRAVDAKMTPRLTPLQSTPRLTPLCAASLAEGLRWRKREGCLFFSDMHLGRVRTLKPDGSTAVALEVDDEPAGLGWLPDGRMLLVLMRKRLLAVKCDKEDAPSLDEVQPGIFCWADLSHVQPVRTNDLVVDGAGNAYVGGFGLNEFWKPGNEDAQTEISLVRAADGHPQRPTPPQTAAEGLKFPNGMVISPDGKTLLVSETYGAGIVAWDRDPVDGSLSNRRCWASLPGCFPDGMCLDAEGALWVAICATLPANPLRSAVATVLALVRNGCKPTGAFIRVHEGGRISETIFLKDAMAICCMLGGPSGKTLYMSCAKETMPEPCKARGEQNGFIAAIEVAVPAATCAENPDYWAGCC